MNHPRPTRDRFDRLGRMTLPTPSNACAWRMPAG